MSSIPRSKVLTFREALDSIFSWSICIFMVISWLKSRRPLNRHSKESSFDFHLVGIVNRQNCCIWFSSDCWEKNLSITSHCLVWSLVWRHLKTITINGVRYHEMIILFFVPKPITACAGFWSCNFPFKWSELGDKIMRFKTVAFFFFGVN